MAGQARVTFENIAAVLAEGDAKPDHMIRMTWYITSREIPCLHKGHWQRLSRCLWQEFPRHGCRGSFCPYGKRRKNRN